MSEIPQDIWEAADKAHSSAARSDREEVNIIARAIMAERERCARICDEIGSNLMDRTPVEAAKAIRRGN